MSPRPSAASEESGAEDEAEAIGRSLPLAWLVALAGIVDVVWNRVALLALDGVDPDAQLWLLRTGALWRNLAAVGGLCAITVGLWRYFRMAGFSTPLRRIQVAALAGLLLPAIVLATLLAKEAIPGVVVLVAVGVGNSLVVLFGTITGGYLGSPLRAGIWGAALTSVLVLVLLVGSTFEGLGMWTDDGESAWGKIAWSLLIACRIAGELIWLGAPLLVVRGLFRLEPLRPPAWAAFAIGLGLALGVGLVGELEGHPDLGVIAYGAFRVQLLPERAVALYAIPIAITLGAAAAAMVGSSRARQVGIFLLLWVAAGFAPRTPIQIVYLMVAALSIARAVQATDPEGRRRAAMAWGDPFAPPSPTRTSSAPPPRPPSRPPPDELDGSAAATAPAVAADATAASDLDHDALSPTPISAEAAAPDDAPPAPEADDRS